MRPEQAPGGDTIAALSTPPGAGAVALVRLSGPDALAIAQRAFSGALKTRCAVFGALLDEGGERLDEGLALYFPAPHSYTGEAVVELMPHGAPLIVQRLLETLYRLGARAARPGEFTYRAFVNGKLDLAQAEAVDALIRAETEHERRAARRGLTGELGRRLAPLSAGLRELISRLEGAVEFVEERIDFQAAGGGAKGEKAGTGGGGWGGELAELEAGLAELQTEMARGAKLRADLTVAIVGPPNAGKSTLFNFLAGGEPAIVSPQAGTTRDLLRERVEIRGLKVRLTDTAGLREAEGGGAAAIDAVESIGMERAKTAGRAADLRLLVLDGAGGEASLAQLEFWPQEETLVVLNKADLGAPDEALTVRLKAAGRLFLVTAAADPARQPELKTALEDFIAPEGQGGEAIAASARALALLAQARAALAAARAAQARGLSEEFILDPLWICLHRLGDLTRPTDREEIYGLIFAGFCIGK